MKKFLKKSFLSFLLLFSFVLISCNDDSSSDDDSSTTRRTERPSILPGNDEISDTFEVEIVSQEEDVTIYYTIDGSIPTLYSDKYTKPFTLSEGEQIVRAFAQADGKKESEIRSKRYTVTSADTKPVVTATPLPNTYFETQFVQLRGSNSDDIIYYTLDGTIPDEYSSEYSSSITVSSSLTIRAFAKTIDGVVGNVTDFKYVISDIVDNEAPVLSYTPTNTITTDTYLDVTLKAVDNTDSNPKIYYTLNGDDPTTSSTEYGSTAITVTEDLTIKAIAVDLSGNISSVKEIVCDITEAEIVVYATPPGKTSSGVITLTDDTITLHVEGTTYGYYSVDNSTRTSYTDGKTIKLSDFTSSLTVKLTLDAGDQIDKKVYSYQLPAEDVVVSASPSGGSFSDSAGVEVTLYVSGASAGTYTIEGESAKDYTDGDKITIGAGWADNTSKKLTLSASNSSSSDSKEYTFTKTKDLEYYATNPNGQVGANVTISSLTKWTENMKIAQGAANDCARSWRGFHEYPDPDLYALYAAWDDKNLYLMVEIPNLDEADTIDNDKSYAGSQFLPMGWAINTGKRTAGQGTMANGDNIWQDGNGTLYTFSSGIDTLIMHHPRLGVGTPGFFITNANGYFSYEEDYCLSFTETGVTRDVYFNESVSANMWAGVTESGDLGGKDSLDVSTYNYVDLKAQGKKASAYQITIPLASLNIDKAYLESTGIGVSVFSTYGMSIMDILPWTPEMIDKAKDPYSKDPSSSAEKEDRDDITVPLAKVGKL